MTHELASALRALAHELRQPAGGGHLPGTLDQVIEAAEQTDGVRLGQLITALQPDTLATAEALTQILDTAASTDPQHDAIQDHLQRWEPVITLTAAAASGDRKATAELTPVLDQLAQADDWAMLTAALRRIAGGEHGDHLLDGLDPIDTAIATETLARLIPSPGSPKQVPP